MTFRPQATHALPQAQPIELVAATEPVATIMLTPAGDARDHGRLLEHQYESTATMFFADALKARLEQEHEDVRVIISHARGEILHTWQEAMMANTIGVDCVLNMHCYLEQGPKNAAYVYQFSYGYDFLNKINDFGWYTADQAYLFSKSMAATWAQQLCKDMSAGVNVELFTVYGPFKLPIKPLCGIKVPAVALEISLKHDDDWNLFVEPIFTSLCVMLDPLIHQRKLRGLSR